MNGTREKLPWEIDHIVPPQILPGLPDEPASILKLGLGEALKGSVLTL
jgi:hypothetical protein